MMWFVPVGRSQVVDDKVASKHIDPSMPTAQMFIVKAEIVGRMPSKRALGAAIVQVY